MKQYATIKSKEAGDSARPVFDVRWKPFFLNVEAPETSAEPIKVRPELVVYCRVEGSEVYTSTTDCKALR